MQLNPENKNVIKKVMTLEKNLEQLNIAYHQAVTQKSVLKIENQVLIVKITGEDNSVVAKKVMY